MATFNELMQKYVNEDYDVLVHLAQQAMVNLLPACKKVDADHDGFYMVSSLILSAIGADGVLTALERKFLRDVLGLDDDQISKYIKMYDSRMADLANHFADNMGTDLKADAAMLIVSICACDEKISKDETAFIRKLFE